MTMHDTISEISQALEFIKNKKEVVMIRYGTYYDINARLKLLSEANEKYALGTMLKKEDISTLISALDEIKDTITQINIKEDNNDD